MPRKSAGLLIAAVVALAAGLAACGGSGGGGSTASSSSNVLKVWWYEGPGSAYQIAWDQAIADFKKQHPGVTVQFSLKSFNQMQQNASMILNSSDVPDVMEYNKGDATTGLLSKQGLLTDLTPEATKYGWDKELGPDLQVTAKYNAKGVMGSGDWYGVSDYAEYLTTYYNKDMFAKYGIQVPTTMAQLTAAMAKFVKAGVTPFANAGNDYMAMQYLYEMELSQSTPQQVQNYERYTGSVNFHDTAWTNAVATFQDWVNKGYIAKDSVGLTATQAGNDFETGKNPMLMSGDWWAGTFESDIKNFSWGTFLWPGNTL
ncbi:MAG: ABC transporter substrate-binding protein, partial [Trebonia sp.]